MISRILQSKYSFLIIIALLTAGLFYFLGSVSPGKQTKILKPSQLDFSSGNQLPSKPDTFHENFNAPPENNVGNPLSPQASDGTAPIPANEAAAWKTLDEILKSKNDNDPRMDRELLHFSTEFHKALYGKYSALKPEARNERGTLVFLIARDLKTPADLEFLQSVYQESPCLNMASCSASPDNDPQDTGAQQTSLNYPQVAGLYQLDKQLSARPELLKDPAFRAGIYSLLKTAENFPAPQVHNKAQQIREKYGL